MMKSNKRKHKGTDPALTPRGLMELSEATERHINRMYLGIHNVSTNHGPDSFDTAEGVDLGPQGLSQIWGSVEMLEEPQSEPHILRVKDGPDFLKSNQ